MTATTTKVARGQMWEWTPRGVNDGPELVRIYGPGPHRFRVRLAGTYRVRLVLMGARGVPRLWPDGTAIERGALRSDMESGYGWRFVQ